MFFKCERGLVSIYVIIIVFFIVFVMLGKVILLDRELDNRVAEFESAVDEKIENTIEPVVDESESSDEFADCKVYSNDIPIYNSDAFVYFSGYMNEDESPKYYIYQEDALYVGGKAKNYILMSDIYVDVDESEIVNWNRLVKRLDFNNHRIFTKDNQVITEVEG